jgi:hypothetical protein
LFCVNTTGAEVSMIAVSVVEKLKSKHLRRLKKGDISSISLASGAQLVPVKAAAVLWIQFGQQHFKHEFLIAEINSSAIFGSDFQGTHGSMICYKTMQFHPLGDSHRSIAFTEAAASDVRVERVTPQQRHEAEQTNRARARARDLVPTQQYEIEQLRRLVEDSTAALRVRKLVMTHQHEIDQLRQLVQNISTAARATV